MDYLERERDVVKQEAFGSTSRGSYLLGRSRNGSPDPIMRDVKTLEVIKLSYLHARAKKSLRHR